MQSLLRRLIWEEEGQDVIEYAMLASSISVIAIPTVPAIGTAINAVYVSVNTKVGTIPK